MRVQFKSRSKVSDNINSEKKYFSTNFIGAVSEKNASWVSKYEPTSANDIAIYPPKLREIRSGLNHNGSTNVLVLSGPAGSGKSTALKLLAQELLLNVVEFHPPETSMGPSSIMDSFRDFLMGCSCFNRASTLILVEELPNVLHENTCKEFENTLLDWCSESNLPIVAISFTEIEVSARYQDALVVPRILGRLIKTPACLHLKMNPPSATLLSKLLKQVVLKEHVQIDAISLKSLAQCGDIRSALNALELYNSTYNHGKQATDNITGHERNPVDFWVRGLPTDLFYAIGKVVWTSSKQGSLEQALEMFGDSMETFNLTVLENYTSAKHQRLTSKASAAICDWLSLADINADYNYLGALGAAHEIMNSEPNTGLPERFVTTKFTQYMKWHHEKLTSSFNLLVKYKNRRSRSLCTVKSLLFDELCYVDKITGDSFDFSDSEDESDDDFEFT